MIVLKCHVCGSTKPLASVEKIENRTEFNKHITKVGWLPAADETRTVAACSEKCHKALLTTRGQLRKNLSSQKVAA